MYKITTFQAPLPTKENKVPWSPYSDKTFVFTPIEMDEKDDILKLYTVLVSNWCLNIPLGKLTEPIRAFRRKNTLEHYYEESINYFILDLDEVPTQLAQDALLEYFNDFKCIIGESKSHNGIDNFNLKGLVFIDSTTIDHAKSCISNLHFELQQYCKVDEAVSRRATYNAPIGKHKVLLNNPDKPIIQCKTQSKQTQIKDGYVEVTKTDRVKLDLVSVTGDTLEEYCVNIFKNMGFEPMLSNDNGSISFKHPSEEKSKGGYFWFEASPYTMHHPNSVRSINIFDAVKKTEIGKELMKVEIDYNDAFLQHNTNTKIINVNKKYLSVDGIEDRLQSFIEQDGGLLSIKSPMGTGKSTIINYVIEESHNVDMRVLIVTNRRSVAADFAKKYGMKVYNKDHYNTGDSLIVQFDSLWRYDIKQFDIVIMDEFISLMMHSRNNLGNSSLNIVKFFGAFNKKLVIADAFLTGYENFLLNHKKTNVLQINNSWRDQTSLLLYEDKNLFNLKLLKTAQKNKITVSGTSTVFLQSTRELLQKHGLKVILLDASIPDSTKDLIYGLFEKDEHDKWDVLLYSPTLTVGVSNLNNVYEHFHYDSSKSTDVISSIQMIKRTRKANNIHMFVSEGQRFLPVTYNTVRDTYMGNMGKVDQNYMFDVDDYGEPKLSKIGVNSVKIDTFKNIMEFNHRSGMLWMLKYHFFSEPRIIHKKYSENLLGHYSKIIKNDKDLALTNNIDEFLRLTDIERTDIILDTEDTLGRNKLMKILIDIDEHIDPTTSDIVRTKIINIALKDKQFIHHCRFYKDTINYTLGLYNLGDIKVRVAKAVISGSDDLVFYNQLIRYSQTPFNTWYQNKPKDKLLLYILEHIGFKMGTFDKIDGLRDIGTMSEMEKKEHLMKSRRVFRINPNVLEFYGVIK